MEHAEYLMKKGERSESTVMANFPYLFCMKNLYSDVYRDERKYRHRRASVL